MPVVGALRDFEQHGSFAVLRSDLSAGGGVAHDGLSGEQDLLLAIEVVAHFPANQEPPLPSIERQVCPS